MSHISSLPVTPSTQSASALSDHITAELHRYDEHLHDVRGLMRVHFDVLTLIAVVTRSGPVESLDEQADRQR